MNKFMKIPVHTFTIDGESYDLVYDMRAKGFFTSILTKNDIDKSDSIGQLCAMFVACVNSAAKREKNADKLIDFDDVMCSNWDYAQLKEVITDIQKAAYYTEHTNKDPNDLYADEEADNEPKNAVMGVD